MFWGFRQWCGNLVTVIRCFPLVMYSTTSLLLIPTVFIQYCCFIPFLPYFYFLHHSASSQLLSQHLTLSPLSASISPSWREIHPVDYQNPSSKVNEYSRSQPQKRATYLIAFSGFLLLLLWSCVPTFTPSFIKSSWMVRPNVHLVLCQIIDTRCFFTSNSN